MILLSAAAVGLLALLFWSMSGNEGSRGASSKGAAGKHTRDVDEDDIPPPRASSNVAPSGKSASQGNAPTSVHPSASTGVVFFSPWGGSKMNQVGRDRPEEGNPEGPMSLAADRSGRVLVLDQVNGRVVRYGASGQPESAVKIDLLAAQDVVAAPDGSMAVLDRLAGKKVALYDAAGKPRGELPLTGPSLEEPGLVTGIFVDGDQVYAEKEHGPLVLLGDTSGRPANPRTELPGRPSRDGKSFLTAGITDGPTGRIYVSAMDRATREHRFTRELRLGAPLRYLLLLDSDAKGTIYVAAQVEGEEDLERILLHCLEPARGAPAGSAELPASVLPEESFRDLTVPEEGGVLYAHRTAEGVSYERYACK
jgi:hypothetical protein